MQADPANGFLLSATQGTAGIVPWTTGLSLTMVEI